MVEAQRSVLEVMTGIEPVSCPWRAFSHPLVREVLKAVQFAENGNLAFALPNPSHRLVEALAVWNQVGNRIQAKTMERDREEAKKQPPGGAR